MFGRFYQAISSAFVFLFAAATGMEVSAGSSVLLAFSSDRCSHCQAMKPTLKQLASDGTPIRHVDVTAEPELAQRHGIRQTPTYVVLSEGREMTRLVGTQSAEKLRQALTIESGGPLLRTGADLHQQSVLNAPETRLSRPAARSVSNVEAMPSVAAADAVQQARAATVRLRVYEGRGFGVGTGTVIDRHGEEALVLTCGHLFRETKLQAKIEVDLFVGGEIKTVPGQVIDYDADERDIALVVIRPGFDIRPVTIHNPATTLQSGQTAFSFGCDHGDDPSRRDTRITAVNKYNQHVKASNVEIAGAPVDGRSGGGLFDAAGRLIGVCNAADYQDDIGIYTGPGSIKWQLDRVQLTRLYQTESAAPTAPRSIPQSAPQNIPPSEPQTRLASLNAPAQNGTVASQPAAGVAAGTTQAPEEMIVIIRDPSDPNGQRVLNVRQPTNELIEMIHRHAGSHR